MEFPCDSGKFGGEPSAHGRDVVIEDLRVTWPDCIGSGLLNKVELFSIFHILFFLS